MTLLYMDGFEHQDYVSRGWVLANIPTFDVAATTRFGYGNCAKFALSSQTAKKAFTPSSKVFVGFAFKNTPGNTLNGNMFQLFADTGTLMHLAIRRIAGTNVLGLFRSTTQIATSPPCLTEGWQYIEVSATLNDTNGNVIVRVDGQVVIDFTGDTRNTTTTTMFDAIMLSTPYSNVPSYYDDLYICNDQGATHNTFLGDQRVVTLSPTGAGATTQLAPTGSPNNWDNVNEFPVSIADYNASATPGARDLYVVENVPASVVNIQGVLVHAAGTKSDAGVASLKPVISSGATVSVGSAVGLSTTLVGGSSMHTVDPNTSSAWTQAGINGIEIGAEVG